MAKSKTEELLGSLTSGEQKAFKEYLDSPFFNCDSAISSLYNFVTGSNNTAFSDRTALYAVLFPGKKYDDKELRYVISGLNKHLINFLTIRHLQKDTLLSATISAKALSDRNCEKAYQLMHHEITQSSSFKDAAWFRLQAEHAEQHLIYTGSKLTRKSTPDYSDTLWNLDTFYLVKKLQLSCEVTNMANILNRKYDISLLDEIKQLATTNAFKDVPAIQVYYHILGTLMPGNQEENFEHLRALVRKYHNLFHPKELGEMYQYMKNFCVRQVNSGSANYLKILFDIYNEILNNRSLMNHDYLSQWEFKNMVSISMRLNEKSWCEKFIRQFSSYLKPEERQNALAYNSAYYLFLINDFRSAIRKLREVELNDVFYQLDARVILLKCYYELDEAESFFYHASAFRLFLLRNKGISEYQKTIYRNLIKFLSAIMRAGTSRAKLKSIKAEIEKEKNVADLNWLLKKVDMAIG